jgi:hypothetical protein
LIFSVNNDYDSCVTKRSSESDIELDESMIKEPVPVLQRNISEEAEDALCLTLESVRSGSSFSSLKKEFIVPTTDFNATIKPYALSTLSNVKQSVDQEEKDFNEKADKSLDDGNISTTDEDKMENFPDVHLPHQCLPVHIH